MFKIDNTKKILVSLLLFLSLSEFGAAQEKVFLFSSFRGNGEDGLHLSYSKDGINWTALNNDSSFLAPVAGVSKLMRDPCIIRTKDGVFHMVWTTGWTERGIGYSASMDLIHWSPQKYLQVMANEPDARNCWAPEIVYDKKKKQFMIFWATTITGRFPETEASGEGHYNHRIYYVTTKNFIIFSDTKLLYEPGFNVIDATIVRKGGKYLMFLKDETISPPQKNIKMATGRRLYGPYKKASSPITGKYWAEGPAAIKIGKTWFVYFDKYTEGKYGAVSSTDLKTWNDISDNIRFPEGTRHGTVFEADEELLNRLLEKRSGIYSR